MNDKFLYCLVSYQVVRKDKQHGDEEENKPANHEPAGSSTDNSNATQTKEHDEVKGDDGFDQVDAAAVMHQSHPVRITQLRDSHESQPAVGEHRGTNSEVPKIEVILTSTQSNSSSEEDSATKKEGKKKKLRKKKQTVDGGPDDNEKDELKDKVNELTRENKTMKNTIDNLNKEKSSLEENLEKERSKIEVREGTFYFWAQ